MYVWTGVWCMCLCDFFYVQEGGGGVCTCIKLYVCMNAWMHACMYALIFRCKPGVGGEALVKFKCALLY